MIMVKSQFQENLKISLVENDFLFLETAFLGIFIPQEFMEGNFPEIRLESINIAHDSIIELN